MTDLDAIRAAHRPTVAATGSSSWCEADRQPWPCDTARAFAAMDEVTAAMLDTGGAVIGERNAANEDAARLADRLSMTAEVWHLSKHDTATRLDDCKQSEGCRINAEALRLHDERVAPMG